MYGIRDDHNGTRGLPERQWGPELSTCVCVYVCGNAHIYIYTYLSILFIYVYIYIYNIIYIVRV